MTEDAMADLTDEELDRIYDPIFDVAERYGITKNDAEAFLEDAGYLSTESVYAVQDEPDEDS